MSTDRDELRRILRDNGFDGSGTNPHSWRCAEKDRYPGDCDCAEATVRDLLAWLAAHDERVRAAAHAEQRETDAQIAERTIDSMTPLGARTKAAIAAAIRAEGTGR